MNRFGGVAAMAAGVVLLAGCGVVPTDDAESAVNEADLFSVIQEAANACDKGHLTQDDGESLTLDTRGDTESYDDMYDEAWDIGCMLEELDAPSYVTEHIESTRALDGQQTDEWDDIEARWTYHPDDGMIITFIDRS